MPKSNTKYSLSVTVKYVHVDTIPNFLASIR